MMEAEMWTEAQRIIAFVDLATGKCYHCDLSALYNIGARYFIRELLKPLLKRKGLHWRQKFLL